MYILRNIAPLGSPEAETSARIWSSWLTGIENKEASWRWCSEAGNMKIAGAGMVVISVVSVDTSSLESSNQIPTEPARHELETLDRLRKALASQRLAVVIGAGITIGATAEKSGKPLQRLCWTGLIRDGLDYLVGYGCVDRSNQRICRAYQSLEEPDKESLLDAANILSSLLKHHDLFPTWLDSVFGNLSDEIRHPAVLEVLSALQRKGAILLTTNYDDILEKFCKIGRVGRSNTENIIKFRSGALNGVFHVHGSFHDPHEVVLDTTDYYQVKHSDETQNMLKAFFDDKTILFIGCGSGLEDPNFEELLKWATARYKNISRRHCLLVRRGDELDYNPLLRIRYGEHYHQLATYLNKILDDDVQIHSIGAQIRLQSKLAHRSDDQAGDYQKHSERLSLAPVKMIPRARNDSFAGRDAEIELLDKYLLMNSELGSMKRSHLRVVVHGLGGVGKTQLVNEYVHRKHDDEDWSIFWFAAGSIKDLDSQMQDVVNKYVKPTRNIRAVASILQRNNSSGQEKCVFTEWIALQQRWIVVFDNLDDPRVDISPYIPADSSGRVIITSRDRNVLNQTVESIHLHEPRAADAKRMFLKLLHTGSEALTSSHPDSEDEEIAQIVAELHYFPLALSQAAAFIRINGPMRFSEYLDHLRACELDRELLLRFKEQNPEYPESIMTTWEVSLRYLEESQANASKLLQLLGFYSQLRVSELMLRNALKPSTWQIGTYQSKRALSNDLLKEFGFLLRGVEFRSAIGCLLSLSLIERDPGEYGTVGPSISVHPLVHEWIKVRLNRNPEEQEKFATVSALLLYQWFPLNLFTEGTPLEPGTRAKLVTNLMQSEHHIWPVIGNVSRYLAPEKATPLECSILILAKLQGAMAAPFVGKREFLGNFPDLPRRFIQAQHQDKPCLQYHQEVFCRAVQRAPLQSASSAWLEIVSRIGQSLDSNSFRDISQQTELVFISIFLSSVLTLLKIQPHPDPGSLQTPPRTYNKQAEKGKLTVLLQLLVSLSEIKIDAMEVKVARIHARLAFGIDINTKIYWSLATRYALTEDVDAEATKVVPQNTAMEYLSLVARLQWHRLPERDLQGFCNTISSVVEFCLHTVDVLEDRHQQEQGSWSSHISSSFGRYASIDGDSLQIEYVSALVGLRTIWNTVPPLFDEIVSHVESHKRTPLPVSELELLSEARKLYDLFSVSFPDGKLKGRPFLPFSLKRLNLQLARLSLKEHSVATAMYLREFFQGDEIVKEFASVPPSVWFANRAHALIPHQLHRLPQDSLLSSGYVLGPDPTDPGDWLSRVEPSDSVNDAHPRTSPLSPFNPSPKYSSVKDLEFEEGSGEYGVRNEEHAALNAPTPEFLAALEEACDPQQTSRQNKEKQDAAFRQAVRGSPGLSESQSSKNTLVSSGLGQGVIGIQQIAKEIAGFQGSYGDLLESKHDSQILDWISCIEYMDDQRPGERTAMLLKWRASHKALVRSYRHNDILQLLEKMAAVRLLTLVTTQDRVEQRKTKFKRRNRLFDHSSDDSHSDYDLREVEHSEFFGPMGFDDASF